MMNNEMARPRSKYPPQTPAQRQAKCRAIKRGTWHYCEEVSCSTPPHCTPNRALPAPQQERSPALPAPATSSQPALPAPTRNNVTAGTAIQKTGSSGVPGASKIALVDADGTGAALRLSLPPAVAARLRSLLERQEAGKSLTASERAEAEGLLDIAEYFIVQRLRRRLAA
jgi:hypothetical protein